MNLKSIDVKSLIVGLLIIIFFSCSKKKEEESDDTNSDLSSCGQIVLSTTSSAYKSCFSGDSTYGSCETCGFYSNQSQAQGSYDCITCPEGYEIDVYFSDCTGYCVKEGTASNPISSNSCNPPIACVKE